MTYMIIHMRKNNQETAKIDKNGHPVKNPHYIGNPHTAGPWFFGPDSAEDCPEHANSGLALVDSGRQSDWPIARLCEWNNVRLIAAAPALLEALKQLATICELGCIPPDSGSEEYLRGWEDACCRYRHSMSQKKAAGAILLAEGK